MNWFSKNAAAIQAFSSLAGVIITAVLVWLTSRYVKLTREIAASSLEQVKNMKEAARTLQQQNALALESIALRIRNGLARLDPDALNHASLRGFSQLTESDIAQIESLANKLPAAAVPSLNDAIASLRTVHAMVQKAKVSRRRWVGFQPYRKRSSGKQRWNRATERCEKLRWSVST